MAIILRNSKSVPLTFSELDGNFSDLNQRVQTLETAGYVTSVNSITPTSGNIALTSANISEQTNLYFTDARARGSIGVTDTGGDGSLTYNSSTGVLTYTGPSASEVRAHFSAGDGISISTGSIAIDTNGVNTTHIDFGTGANQVNTDQLPQGSTNLYYSDASVDTRIAASSIDVLSDVDTTGVYAPTSNQVLTWNGSSWKPATPPGAAGGEANNIVQVGTGKDIFYQKNGVDFQLRRIQGDSNILVQDSGTSLLINMTSAPTFGNIQIKNNTIENTTTNNDINITPNGTGAVVVSGDLTATLGTAAQPNITSIGTLAADLILGNTHDIVLQGSSFSTTVVSADPSENRTITLPDATGTAITTGNLSSINQLASTVTGDISFSGDITVASANIDNLSINNNSITNTVSNQNLTLVANGTGSIDVSTSKIVNLVDPTSNQDAATKSYVDTQTSAAGTLTTSADSGTGSVVLSSQTLSVNGTANEINTSVSGQTITLGLPDSVNISNNLTIGGNFTVNGTTTTVDTANLNVTDSLIRLAVGNESSDAVDIGFVGHYYDGANTSHAGLFRDATDGKFKMFSAYDAEPITNTINTSDALFRLATLQLEALEIGDTDNPSLHVRGSAISTVNTNQSISITTAGSGTVDIDADVQLQGQSDLRFADADSSNYVAFQAPATVTSNVTWTLPTTDSAGVNYSLVSDGAGTLSWSETATTANNVTVTANNTANETVYVTFVDGATGTQGIETDTDLTYNPSTNTLSASFFSGTATQAQYADLAEIYTSDQDYPAGTVVRVGGSAEITYANSTSRYIAGVISTNPAYLMNSGQHGQPVALVGRVPVRVVGTVEKGDPVFADNNGIASKTADGPLVGIALQGSIDPAEKLIECMLKV